MSNDLLKSYSPPKFAFTQLIDLMLDSYAWILDVLCFIILFVHVTIDMILDLTIINGKQLLSRTLQGLNAPNRVSFI